MIFCQTFLDRPVVSPSTSLTAATTAGSSWPAAYNAASFPVNENISVQ